jgi:hypothetical protein
VQRRLYPGFYQRWDGVLGQTTRVTNNIDREAKLAFSIAVKHLRLLHEELSLLPTPKKDAEGNIVYKTLFWFEQKVITSMHV